MKATGRTIQIWLANKGHKSRDCGPFIAVDNNKEVLTKLLIEVKKQFPENKSYLNEETEDIFISIEK